MQGVGEDSGVGDAARILPFGMLDPHQRAVAALSAGLRYAVY